MKRFAALRNLYGDDYAQIGARMGRNRTSVKKKCQHMKTESKMATMCILIYLEWFI